LPAGYDRPGEIASDPELLDRILVALIGDVLALGQGDRRAATHTDDA